jgi:serine protease Do
MRHWFKQLIGTLGVGAAFLGSGANAQNLSPELYEAIIKASVQFVCFDQTGKPQWIGSGSFIGREGIILTNNHVVANEQNNQVCPILRISMMKNEDQPPEPRYIGRVVTRLPNVDLALVQVATDLRGNPVPSGTRFPAVPLGDSNTVRVGERIFNFGFPDINGTSETITVSSGSVNGFLENRTFMKHDALSGPGGSGGGLYNLRGEIVAVHSAGVSGNNNTRQPLGRPLVLGLPMIQQNVRGFGEPWTTQLAGGSTQPNPPSNQPTQPPSLPTQPSQPPSLPTQPTQPPSVPTNNSNLIPAFPPKVGETWTVTLQGLAPWTVQFTALDTDGDPTGTATQSGITTEAWAFKMQDGSSRFQMVSSDKNGSFFCDFKTLQVSGNAFVGGASARSVRNPNGGGNQFSSLNTTCTAAIVASAQPQPPTPPPTQNLSPVFPPKPGQKWTLTIDGLNSWMLDFTKLDSDGDPTGTGTQNGVAKTAFAFTAQDGSRYFQVFDAQNTVYYCIFPNRPQVSGASFVGGRAFSAQNPQANATNMNRACSTTITADGAGAVTVPPSLPTTTTASFPPKPGQNWTLTIDGFAPWALQFTRLDSDGDPTGTGTQNGVAKNVFAFAASASLFRFQVFDAQNTVYYCDFPRNAQPNGATFGGGNASSASTPQAQPTPLNRVCSVTLLSSALLSQSSSTPLEMMFKLR